MGTIESICISEKKGTVKHEVPEAEIIEDWGIKGDAHAGKWHRQVSLLSYEKIAEFNDRGADVRDGALSGSTLKEASSWGKVSTALEQMVYGECTTLIPLIIGYGYHKGAWKKRKASNYIKFLQDEDAKIAKSRKK